MANVKVILDELLNVPAETWARAVELSGRVPLAEVAAIRAEIGRQAETGASFEEAAEALARSADLPPPARGAAL